jgi:hypothetical protein
MLADHWVWIVALIVVALLAGLAIWRGRGGEIGVGLKGLSVRIRHPAPTDDVTVAKHTTIAGTVASITGRDIQGPDPTDHGPRTTNVAQDLRVPPGGTVGAIIAERVIRAGAGANAKKPKK